jgi:hydroxymethylpyrimidine pyrophosphatase-like HAD family hydrolase
MGSSQSGNRLTMNSQHNPQTSRVRLVIADVDGTLVTQDKLLTARATEAVKKLHDAGILFGITSGRQRDRIEKQLSGLNAALAAFAGAYSDGKPSRKRRRMSAKSRAKIAAAQRRRWAKVRAKKS